MRKIKKLLRFVFALLPGVNTFLLRLVGDDVSSSAKLGSLLIWCDELHIGEDVSVGSFNLISVPFFRCGSKVVIRSGNLFKGDFKCFLDDYSGVSRFNKFTSEFSGKTRTFLHLKRNARVTQRMIVDLTSNVTIGENSQLAGIGSQIWTHGYFHLKGNQRFRVDGSVVIGDDCYIGSHSMISPGTVISNGCNFASLSNIVGRYDAPGLYASSKAVYKKSLSIEEVDSLYSKITNDKEVVYKKG